MKPKELIPLIILLIGTCFGVYFWATGEFASAQGLRDANQKIERTNERIDQQNYERKYEYFEERIYKYQDIAEKRKLTDLEKEQLEKFKSEKERLWKYLQAPMPVGVKK